MITSIGMQGHRPATLIWPCCPMAGAATFGQNEKKRRTRTRATARRLQQRPATEQRAGTLTTASTIATPVATATAIFLGQIVTIRVRATANATQGMHTRTINPRVQPRQDALPIHATDATRINLKEIKIIAQMRGPGAILETTGGTPP